MLYRRRSGAAITGISGGVIAIIGGLGMEVVVCWARMGFRLIQVFDGVVVNTFIGRFSEALVSVLSISINPSNTS
jgi:hypothetical protein